MTACLIQIKTLVSLSIFNNTLYLYIEHAEGGLITAIIEKG